MHLVIEKSNPQAYNRCLCVSSPRKVFTAYRLGCESIIQILVFSKEEKQECVDYSNLANNALRAGLKGSYSFA